MGDKKREEKKLPHPHENWILLYILAGYFAVCRYFAYYYYYLKAYDTLASKHPGGMFVSFVFVNPNDTNPTVNSKLGNKKQGKPPKLLFRRYTFKELQSHA